MLLRFFTRLRANRRQAIQLLLLATVLFTGGAAMASSTSLQVSPLRCLLSGVLLLLGFGMQLLALLALAKRP